MNEHEVYNVKLNFKKSKFKIKRIAKYEDDGFGWVNNTVLSSGQMYVTKDKIDWGKKKILQYFTKQYKRELELAQLKYDQLNEVEL